MKSNFLFIFFTVAFLFSCSNESIEVNPSDPINFVLFKTYSDVYPTAMYGNIKKNKIKSIQVISTPTNSEKLDSLTILKFDELGRLDKRITKECTTIGCLPYMNLQQYHYSDNLIQRIDIYTFNDNKRSTKSMWNTVELDKLEKYDWEDYLYSNDTIKVESAISNWTFLIDDQLNIIERVLEIKSTGQSVTMNFSYTDSSCFAKSMRPNGEILSVVEYKYINNSVEVRNVQGDESLLFQVWHLNKNGLVTEKVNYSAGVISSRTQFIYSFYQAG